MNKKLCVALLVSILVISFMLTESPARVSAEPKPANSPKYQPDTLSGNLTRFPTGPPWYVSETTAWLGYPVQRKTCYANGYYWMFINGAYPDNNYIDYFYSSDAETWTQGSSIRSGDSSSLYFGIACSGINFAYVYAVSTANHNIYYRSATLESNATISWHAAEQTALAALSGIQYKSVTIAIASDDTVWIGYARVNATATTPWVLQSSSLVTSGTWTNATDAHQIIGSVGASKTNFPALVVPLSHYGNVLVIAACNGVGAYSQEYSGGSWGTVLTSTTSITGSVNGDWSATADGNDNVAFVSMKGTGGYVRVLRWTNATQTWDAGTNLQSVTNNVGPVITANTVSNYLYVFWLNQPTANTVYYDVYNGTAWGSPVTWLTLNNMTGQDGSAMTDTITSFDHVQNGMVGVVVMNNTAAGDAGPGGNYVFSVFYETLSSPANVSVTWNEIGLGSDVDGAQTALTIDSVAYTKTELSGAGVTLGPWNVGSAYTVAATTPITGSTYRYAFANYTNGASGGLSSAPSGTYTVPSSGSLTVTVYYGQQVPITFTTSAIGSDTTTTIVTVNSVTHLESDLPYTANYTIGSSLTYSFTSPVTVGSTKRYAYNGTSGLGQTAQSTTFTVATSGTITATYKAQWKVIFAISGVSADSGSSVVANINGTNLAQTSFPDTLWPNNNTAVSWAFSSPVATTTTGKEYVFSSLSGMGQTAQSGSTAVTSSGTITATYITEYQINFTAPSTLGIDVNVATNIVTIAGINHTLASMPNSTWYASGFALSYALLSPIVGSNLTYTWAATGGTLGQTLQSNSFSVSGPGSVFAIYTGGAATTSTSVVSTTSTVVTTQGGGGVGGTTSTSTQSVTRTGPTITTTYTVTSGYLTYTTTSTGQTAFVSQTVTAPASTVTFTSIFTTSSGYLVYVTTSTGESTILGQLTSSQQGIGDFLNQGKLPQLSQSEVGIIGAVIFVAVIALILLSSSAQKKTAAKGIRYGLW